MQLKSFLTEDQILNNHRDPLFLTCHPLSKLKMAATIIFNECEDVDNIPLETFREGEVCALGEIIDDAADEIQFLVGLAQEQFRRLENRLRELEKKYEYA